MADRTATPDILGAVISGEAIKEESNKTIKQDISKEIKKASKKAINPEGNKAGQKSREEDPKEKATYNLPVKLLMELEDKWMEMRRISGSKKVSKTLIVEEALKMAFSDFDLKKDSGKFYSNILNNNDLKK